MRCLFCLPLQGNVRFSRMNPPPNIDLSTGSTGDDQEGDINDNLLLLLQLLHHNLLFLLLLLVLLILLLLLLLLLLLFLIHLHLCHHQNHQHQHQQAAPASSSSSTRTRQSEARWPVFFAILVLPIFTSQTSSYSDSGDFSRIGILHDSWYSVYYTKRR